MGGSAKVSFGIACGVLLLIGGVLAGLGRWQVKLDGGWTDKSTEERCVVLRVHERRCSRSHHRHHHHHHDHEFRYDVTAAAKCNGTELSTGWGRCGVHKPHAVGSTIACHVQNDCSAANLFPPGMHRLVGVVLLSLAGASACGALVCGSLAAFLLLRERRGYGVDPEAAPLAWKGGFAYVRPTQAGGNGAAVAAAAAGCSKGTSPAPIYGTVRGVTPVAAVAEGVAPPPYGLPCGQVQSDEYAKEPP